MSGLVTFQPEYYTGPPRAYEPCESPYYWPTYSEDGLSPTGDYGSPPPPYNNPAAPPPDYEQLTISGLGTGHAELLGFLGSGECGAPQPVRGVKRRVTANRKERRRTQSINNAFADLRDCIPNVPADTKLSKIKTLRLATSYIAYLMELLAQDGPRAHKGAPESFKVELGRFDEKRKKEPAACAVMPVEKKPKGRTGWPQHVWALELQQEASV